ELFGELDGFLNGLASLAGQTDDEIAMHANTNFATILHEGASHFNGRTLLDIFQDLRIAGFKANDEKAGARIGHALQGFVIAVYERGGRPAELQRLKLAA